MADPRNTEAYDEIKPVDVTYKIDASTITYDATKKGGSAQSWAEQSGGMLAVTLSSDKTVALCADGDPIEGGLLHVESDGRCAVRVGGYLKLRGGASATLTLGSKIVGALGAASAKGYIRTHATGTAAEAAKARGRIIDNDTTTAVVVHLEG
jgi:hypothetical protein